MDYPQDSITWTNGDVLCTDLPTAPKLDFGKVLVTGATGYIGGRLVPELLARGYSVRVMVRADSEEYLERWPGAEVVAADALDIVQLREALKDIEVAYYLIHSMLLGRREFELADIEAAKNFRKAAEEKKLKRIIYLGGLGNIQSNLSNHLKSRMKVAEELSAGEIPVTILRAAIIIGSGSASYEIIEHLVRKTPVFFNPYWARTRCQPIALRDVIKYLVGVLETDETNGKVYDIGGTDILAYEEMMKVFAKLLGKKKLFFHSPFSSVRLYSYVASLITPVPAQVISCLMEGTRDEVICQNDDIRKVIPFRLLPYKESLLRAMSREDHDKIATRWSDAYPPAHELAIKLSELENPPRFISTYALPSTKSKSALFESICLIGGREGWFHSNWMWRLRGMLDRILMGVGTSRGRRSSYYLRINDVIDFWRVEDLKQDQYLLLRAEMKVPGKAWLKFQIVPEKEKNLLSVTAYFEPKGTWGKIYWYTFLPFHYYIFKDLIKQLEKRSKRI
jgi:uncharacterized protein YbjT (DUF2867 family)